MNPLFHQSEIIIMTKVFDIFFFFLKINLFVSQWTKKKWEKLIILTWMTLALVNWNVLPHRLLSHDIGYMSPTVYKVRVPAKQASWDSQKEASDTDNKEPTESDSFCSNNLSPKV